MNPFYRNGIATGVVGGWFMSMMVEGDFKAAGILAVVTIGLFLYDYRRGFVGPIVCALFLALTLVSAQAQSGDDEIKIRDWPGDVPCAALRKNPDGTYTQVVPFDISGIKMRGNTFHDSTETRYWDQHCAGKTAQVPPSETPSRLPADDTVPPPETRPAETQPAETQPPPPDAFPTRPLHEPKPFVNCKALTERVNANLHLIDGMLQQRDSSTSNDRWCAAMQRRYDQLVEEAPNLIETCLQEAARNRMTQRVLTVRAQADRQIGQRCR